MLIGLRTALQRNSIGTNYYFEKEACAQLTKHPRQGAPLGVSYKDLARLARCHHELLSRPLPEVSNHQIREVHSLPDEARSPNIGLSVTLGSRLDGIRQMA